MFDVYIKKRQVAAKTQIKKKGKVEAARVEICMLIFNLENWPSSRNVRSYHYTSRCTGTVPVKVEYKELAGNYCETVRTVLDNDSDNKSENHKGP